VRHSLFDEEIDRSVTPAVALDRERHGVPPDAIPLWIADMGFAAPEPVIRALVERARHGIFGYERIGDTYTGALTEWFARRHGWTVDTRGLVVTRGAVHALYLAVEALTAPGDGVIVQPPVYPPFFAAVRDTGRRLLNNPLVQTGERYEIDFDGFEAAAREATAFILCSPHNPVGRVWTPGELERAAEICLRHGVRIISDEVHADIVYPGAHHTVTASLADEVDAVTVTVTAPSKTFNLAGLQVANVFAADAVTRRRLRAAYASQGLSQPPDLGMVACEAAYSGEADRWVDQLVAYLDGTMTVIGQFLEEHLASVRWHRPEGTYLAWLDFTGLGLDPTDLRDLVIRRARLWLNDGDTFGHGGTGFWRLNAAYPRSVVRRALERLAAAST
jgi:cystathionine beta-lyase